VRKGATITLKTPVGERTIVVVGVVYDYASEQGGVVVPMSLFREWYGDLPLSSLAAYVVPGADVDETVQVLQQTVSPIQELDVRSNVGLRTATLEIFDRTFAITGVLQLLATIIAFVGILSALMALQLERTRELGVMRANGLTPRQLWGIVLGQTGLIGITAGLLSLPVGVMVATVLVYIINRRSFGWTLRFVIPPSILLQAVVLALLAALLAGLYPAFRMGRTPPAVALREE
jgi:putative ABC transport system permease protein